MINNITGGIEIMGIKSVINKDIQELDEKLQTIKGTISDKEYKELSTQVEEIKKLAFDLPDEGYISETIEVVQKILKLEFGKLSDSLIGEKSKVIKLKSFIERLEYIKVCIKQGKDVSELIEGSYRYWNSIKEIYDEIEISQVERQISEVVLENILSKASDLSDIGYKELINDSFYFLIREKLQDLSVRKNINIEKKLLVGSWLGEIIDVKNGELDEKAMEKLIKDKKLWEVLAEESNS